MSLSPVLLNILANGVLYDFLSCRLLKLLIVLVTFSLTEECLETVERCKALDKEGQERVKDIENKIKNSKTLKEKELKAANAELASCKNVAEETRSKWTLKRQARSVIFYITVFDFIYSITIP